MSYLQVNSENISIENMIYEIRGKQVMLDRDLAYLYNVETRILIQKVKRNIERFPENFCFQMSDKEFQFWKSQIVMSENDKRGLRRPPYVFTEQGVAMLSAILKSDVAVKVSIKIINAFVTMRKYLSSNIIEQEYINKMVFQHDSEIKLLQESFKKFEEKKIINEIYFNGQIYDAYSKILDILRESKKNITIIDAYASKHILDMICKISVDVLLITKKDNNLTTLDINKYNMQYNNLKVIYNNSFHDRYIILDNITIYHLGASINYAGSKTFSINLLTDKIVIDSLITKINDLII